MPTVGIVNKRYRKRELFLIQSNIKYCVLERLLLSRVVEITGIPYLED